MSEAQLKYTEQELVSRCMQHDRIAQKALYDRYKDLMFTIAYRISNNYEYAGEALQECFIDVFKNLHQFRGPYGLKSWIKTILIRAALKQVKKNRQHLPYNEELSVVPSEEVNWPDRLTGAVLQVALSKLPDLHRSVFVLIEIEGYSHKESAEMLDISSENSRVLLFRAKTKLQTLIRPLL